MTRPEQVAATVDGVLSTLQVLTHPLTHLLPTAPHLDGTVIILFCTQVN